MKRVLFYKKMFGIRGIFLLFSYKLFNKPKFIFYKKVKFPIKLRMLSSDIFTCYNILESGEYPTKAGGEISFILDCGANIGLASIFFSEHFPKVKIVAIEAVEENYLLLCENVKNYPNVIPIHAALWNKDGEHLSIHNEFGNKDGFTVRESLQNADTPTITISKIIEQFSVQSIDILKMDIEGAEKEVFESSKFWLDKVKNIFIEFHDRKKRGCSRTFYEATSGIPATEYVKGELNCWERL